MPMSAAARSRVMSSVRSKNSGIERTVRSSLFKAGFRFRLHDKRLPGRPDIVLPRFKTAVFVHGCFWHKHNCPKGREPRTRTDYWQPKLAANQQRDKFAVEQLAELGWDPVIIWECELADSTTALIRALTARDS